MKETVKITDVAERAGVAKSTVSNVLTGKKFVSDELKEKVLKACEELDFQPNFYASALSGHKSGIVALFLESGADVDKPMYRDVIVACLKEASKNGYSLLVYYNADNDQLLKTLRQGMAPIDGAVLMTPRLDDMRLKQIQSDCIDCVMIGRPDGGLNFNYVDVDNVKLVKDVLKELIARYGKDIYLINSDSALTISHDRAKGFYEICNEYGIDGSFRLFESKESTEEDGYAYALKTLKRRSVYVTANGSVAAGVYRAVEEKGLKVGGDVGVFALGRSQQHGSFRPRLSYAEQNYHILGQKAVEFLAEEIKNGRKGRHVLIESGIFFTESTQNG